MMMGLIHTVIGLGLVVLAAAFGENVLALWAVICRGPRMAEPPAATADPQPQFIILVSCFNAAESLPGFMACMRALDYPRERVYVMILADNCTDSSASVAQSLRADEVYVRNAPDLPGKGNALNEVLEKRLKHQDFDALILFDIDARIDSQYLRRAAVHFNRGVMVFQGATVSKNPDETALTQVGEKIQALLRLHQFGRSLLGLPPFLIGSHGIGLHRMSLERLDWRIVDILPTGDDLELGVRCFLRGVPMTYAPDLPVVNDLPASGQEIKQQRRRWTRSALRLTPHYLGPLGRRVIQGDWRAIDALGIMILPSFSNLFLFLSLATGVLGLASSKTPGLRPEAAVAAVLWGADVLYFFTVFHVAKTTLTWRESWGMLKYLGVRAAALMESLLMVRSNEWWPTRHAADVEKKDL